MNVDWNVETEGGGGLYQPGVYKVKINEIIEVEAKSSGNMQLRIKGVIVDGDADGRKITEHITLVDSCGWKLVKFIKAMCLDVKTLEKMDTDSGKFRAVLNKCIGRTTYWVLDIVKDREGKDRNDIVDYKEDTEGSWDNAVDEPEFLNK